MYEDIKAGNYKIKKDWLLILEGILALKNMVLDVKENFKELPRCLILAQKISNQFDYFKQKYGIPNEVVPEAEFIAKKKERNGIYQDLYKVFDELRINEIVQFIMTDLQDNLTKYKMYVSGDLASLQKNEWLEALEIRDSIKLLYDELEIWQGRWKGEGAKESCSLRDKLCQELSGYDNLLREHLLKNKEEYAWLNEEAENRLIPKPDGTRRFDFWWRRINLKPQTSNLKP